MGLTPPELQTLDAERLAYLEAWAEGRMVGQWTHNEQRERGVATPGQVGGELPYGPP